MGRATVDHLLTTTRTVRRRLDLTTPVEPEVIQECLEIAIQAPNGGNQNRYHFVIVTDPAKRAAIGAIYKRVFYQEHVPLSGAGDPGLPVYQKRSESIQDSASYLADHMSEVPVHIIPCVESRFENAGTFRQATRYGSILPAAWSLMLALRSRGLGTAWTTCISITRRRSLLCLAFPTISLRRSFCLWPTTRALTSGSGSGSLLTHGRTGTLGD
jgi:nitroreductase